MLRKNRSRFGMMFLHDLDLENKDTILPEVDQEDTPDVLAELKVKAKVSRRPQHNTNPTELHPLGKYPSWQAVQNAIRTSPSILIPPFSMPRMLVTSTIQKLFCAFTNQMWDNLSDARISGQRPFASTLEEAMKTWAVTNVSWTIVKVQWDATNTGMWNVIRGRKEHTFRQRAALYFPAHSEHIESNPVWRRFCATRTGYLRQYWDTLEALSEEDALDIQNDLSDIFFHLQCLPHTTVNTAHKIPATVWHIQEDCIRISTNPTHYKVAGIGNTRSQPQARSGKATVPEATFLRRQLERAGVRGRDLQQAMAKAKGKKRNTGRKSGRAKNARQPPRRAGSSGSSSSSSEDEDDEEHSNDDEDD